MSIELVQPQDEPITEPTEDRTLILNGLDIGDEALHHGDLKTGVFKCNNGVVLKVRRANPSLIQKAVEQFKVPDVPEVFDTEREINIPNPADPDYVTAAEKYQADVLTLVNDIYTSQADIVSVPDELQRPENTEWSEDIQDLYNVEVPVRGRARFLAWLNYHVMDADEYQGYIAFCMFYNGRIREEDIRNRVNSFRNNEGEHTDNGVSDTQQDTARDNV